MHTDSEPTAGASPSEGTSLIRRRTILAGAAWTVPVIVTATATPAMAASPTELTLAFNLPSYSGTACSTITGASVTATRGGQPAAGEPVTVTLSSGYRFADGSMTYTAVSGADGRVALPAISVPATGGMATVSATTGTASASAALTGTSQSGQVYLLSAGGTNPLVHPDLPAGVTVVDLQYGGVTGQTRATVLGSDGNVYTSTNRAAWVVAPGFNGTAKAITVVNGDGTGAAATDGTRVYLLSAGGTNPLVHPDLPAGVTVVDLQYGGVTGQTRATVLGSDGNVYTSTNRAAWVVAPGFNGTAKAITVVNGDGTGAAATDGTRVYLLSAGGTNPLVHPDLPAGVTVVDLQYGGVTGQTRATVLGSDGNVYTSTNRAAWVVAPGFNGTAQGITVMNGDGTGAAATDGTRVYLLSAGGTNPLVHPDLPAGVTVVDLQYGGVTGQTRITVLGSDGNVYTSTNRAAWVVAPGFNGTAQGITVMNGDGTGAAAYRTAPCV